MQNNFRRAGVPLFGARREVNVEIALLFDNQADFDSDRAAPHFLFDTKAWTTLSMRGLRCDRLAASRIVARFHVIRYARSVPVRIRALDPGAAAANCAIQNAGQRLVNNSEHAFAVFRQTNLHCEVAVAVDEAGSAVERIDHPDARLVEAACSVNRFFSQDAVVGKFPAQPRAR